MKEGGMHGPLLGGDENKGGEVEVNLRFVLVKKKNEAESPHRPSH
jgi:hypothetical protein